MAANVITTTTADDLTYAAALLNQAIIDALYELNVFEPLVRKESIASVNSKALDFPKTPKLAAASVAEGVDLTYTPFVTSKTTITAGEVGIVLTPTDVANVSLIVGNPYYAAEAAKAMANKLSTDIAALAAGFSQQCGATGVNLSEQNILDGITLLMAGSVPGPYRAVLHPQQWNDFAAGIGATINPVGYGTSSRGESNQFGAVPDGGLGRFYGVEWVVSAAVPTATAGADRLGMMVCPSRALGMVEKWSSRTELERDASLRATEIVVTANYGVGEIDDLSGIGILTDA
jgi:hypothetical protein